MIMGGSPECGCELYPIDFAKYAEACGVPGHRLERAEDAERVIGEAFRQRGTALVECTVDANEPPMPGHATTSQALHFAEALARGERGRWDIIKTVMANKIRE